MKQTPRILIVTAAFGEGHNSAARNMALALDAEGAVCQVADPILQGAPMTTAIVSRVYRFITTRLPWVWYQIYKSTDRCDFSKRQSPVMRFPEKALGRLIDQFKPDAIVSTYPLYPYFLRRIRQGIDGKLPMITVVTDSIEINASWLRSPSDHWLVTDNKTREKMDPPVSIDKITATGFPVHPRFASQSTVAVDDACSPFRVLYFATANPRLLSSHGRALLSASPDIRLTIVMGRNVRKLVRRAQALKQAYPGRVRLIGWTRAATAGASSSGGRQGRWRDGARGDCCALPHAHPSPRARAGGGQSATPGIHRWGCACGFTETLEGQDYRAPGQ